MLNEQFVEREFTFSELGGILGFESFEEEADLNIEDLGLQVETPNGFSNIDEFYVKPKTTGYQHGSLIASGDHRVFINGQWTKLKDAQDVLCLNRDIEVVDISVPDGNCYVANGHVNHNTTPGGWF